MYKFKKAISPVIAVILLLAITVVISMSMYSFLQDYTQSTTSSLSSNTLQGNVEVKHLFANQLYLNSMNSLNLTLLKIQDSNGNELCSFSGNTEVDSTGLVGYWTFDEIVIHNATHNKIIDLSGNGNDGYFEGNSSPQLVPSNNGNAFRFDGINDYVRVLHSSSLNLETNFTIFTFSKIDDFSIKQRILSKTHASSYALGVQKNSSWGNLHNGSLYYDILDENKFKKLSGDYALTLTHSNLEIVLIENFNVVDKLLISNSEISTNSVNLCFGGEAGPSTCRETNFFKGEIDEIRIYNRTLSQAEIKQLYWNLIKNKKSGISQIDISSCGLQKNSRYIISLIDQEGNKFDSTQIVN